MLQKQRNRRFRVEVLPGQAYPGLGEVEMDSQRQGGVAPALAAVRIHHQPVAPRLASRGMMVDLDDRAGAPGHRLEHLGREGEVDDDHLVAGDFGHFPRLTVVHRPVGGAVAETQPGRIGGAEAVRAVGVVEDGDRMRCRHGEAFQ